MLRTVYIRIGRRFGANIDRVVSSVRHSRGRAGVAHQSQYSETAQRALRVQAVQAGRLQMRHRGRDKNVLQCRRDQS